LVEQSRAQTCLQNRCAWLLTAPDDTKLILPNDAKRVLPHWSLRSRVMKRVWSPVIGLGMLILIAVSASPQTVSNFGTWEFPNRERVNEGTVTIMTGPVGGLTPIMGADLARVLDDGETLRVLPVGGKGSVQNIIDILSLKSIDMGIVVSDVAEFFR